MQYLCSSVKPPIDFYYCPGQTPEFRKISDLTSIDPSLIPSIRIEVFKALCNQTLDPVINGTYSTTVSVIPLPNG